MGKRNQRSERESQHWMLSPGQYLRTEEVVALRNSTRSRISGRGSIRKSSAREWIVLEIALETGLRVSEIAALRCGDFKANSEGGVLLVRRGKGGKSRRVRYGRKLAVDIAKFVEWKCRWGESLDNEAFFLPSGRTWKSITPRALQKMFSRVAAKARVQGHTFHHLRHTYATHLYKASGNNLRLVQKQLGHASVRTTEVYADVMDETAIKAVNTLYEVPKI